MKPKSDHAAAAAIIRKQLRAHGINARVRSESYSGGDSIRVAILQDVLPATRKEIESFCKQFQSGHFDGMIDCYEYSNSRDDIPQVKFVFVDVDYSDAIRQEVRDYVAARYAAQSDFDLDRQVWATLSGSPDNFGFWNSRKPRIRLQVQA